jgi:ABC-type transporter Mla subunit MlaD
MAAHSPRDKFAVIAKIGANITWIGAVAAAVFALIPQISSIKTGLGEIRFERADTRLDALEKAVAGVQKETEVRLVQADKALARLAQLPPEAQSAALLASLDDRSKLMDSRLKSLEGVIVQDPQKSLTLVLVKKDLESLQKSLDDKITTVNASIERLYGIFGWSIGALLIAIVGQLLAGFFTRKQLEPH